MKHHLATGRLAPFAGALQGEVVGTHDGVRATLHLDALDDDVVFYHEFGHEILFTRTTDGSLLAILWQAIDRPRALSQDRLDSLIITSQTLAAHCRYAHEVFATYYGLKMVEPAVAIAALPRLPEEYRKYFDAAASVLDLHFRGTFVQVRMALSLSAMAFESRFATRFLKRPWSPWKSMRGDEQPDRRLETLFGVLADTGASELRGRLDMWAAEFFASTGAPGWDLEDDAGWQAHEVEANELDHFLDQMIVDWVGSRGVLPILRYDERLKCYDQLRRFAAECGIPVQVSNTSDPVDVPGATGLAPVLEHFRKGPAARAHGLRQAESFVANRPLAMTFERVTREELCTQPAYRDAFELLVVGPDPAQERGPWTIVRFVPPSSPGNVWLNGRHAHAAQAAGDDVIAWLNTFVHDANRQRHGVLSGPIVIPFGSEAQLGSRHFSLDDDEESGKISFVLNRLMAMYVVGNWFAFVKRAAEISKVVLTEVQVEIPGDDGLPKTFVVKIALSEALYGRFFFRAFALNASVAVDLLALDWQSDDAIQQVSVDEAQEAGLDMNFVTSAINGILSFWSRF